MEKRILAYVAYLEKISQLEYSKEEREELCKKVLVQIGFFQHERLIHLIVTVTFAILAVVAFAVCALKPGIGFFALEFAILVLLIPYIRHYFILENSVQKMYEYYDVLRQEDFSVKTKVMKNSNKKE